MKKKVIFLGAFLLSFVFLSTHCFAGLINPNRPRKTGASIYNKRGAAARPAASATSSRNSAMDEAMSEEMEKGKEVLKEEVKDSRYNRTQQNQGTRKTNR